MNLRGIRAVILELTGFDITACDDVKNVYIPCPLAPWKHESGTNKKRSMSIKVDPLGNSPCYCWHADCRFTGTIRQLISAYEEHSGHSCSHVRAVCNIHSEADMGDLLAALTKKPQVQKTIPHSEISHFLPYRKPWRGLTIPTLEKWDVRLDREDKRIFFPVINRDGELVGGVGRTLVGHKVKYKNYFSEVFRKTQVLFGEGVDHSERVVILEGQVDAIKVWQALGGEYAAVAIMGSSPSTTQINKILKYYKEVTLFMDPDKPGLLGKKKLASQLINKVPLKTVPFYVGKDAGDMTEEEIIYMVKSAYPIVTELI